MPSKSPEISPDIEHLLHKVGEQIRQARLRRNFTAKTVAERSGMSRVTLSKIEKGDPNVTFGSYCAVLHVLGFADDIRLIAANDFLVKEGDDVYLKSRQRASGQRGLNKKSHKRDPHELSEARTLATHKVISERIKADPDACLAKAKENILRWAKKSGASNPVNNEWLSILEHWTPEKISKLISSDSEEAYRLRSSSPFVGILSQAERKQIRSQVVIR